VLQFCGLNLYDSLVIIALFIWIFLIIISQTKFDKKIRSYDSWGMLPGFRFFSPKPVSRDYKIYVKGCNSNISGSWIELLPINRTIYNFIWNPESKLTKFKIDLINKFSKYETDKSENLWHLSYSYIVLLNTSVDYLKSTNHNHTHIQFLISSSCGHDNSIDNVIFISNIHRL
jgi:hypothetical protein